MHNRSSENIITWIVFFLLISCSKTPSGRRQLNLIGDAQMSQLGDQSFEELKKKTASRKDEWISCISHRLLKSAGENPLEWKVLVFEDKTANAFALPGKNIGIHQGMIDLAENEHQLAAVIGHEIGHVQSQHGNERVSQNLLAQTGLVAANIFIGSNSKSDQLILAGLGLGAQFGVLLPFSRKHEREADFLGIQYMLKAGYNPAQAAQLWMQMKKKSKSDDMPEILSTHPSHESRINALSAYAKKYQQEYQRNKNKVLCR